MDFCRKKIYFTLISLHFILLSYGQDSILTIEQIIAASENNYPGLMLYQSRIKARNELVKGAKSLMPSTVAIGLDRFPYRTEGATDPDNEMNTEPGEAGIMFMAEQMFINPSRLNAKRNYLSSLANVERNNFYWTRNRIANEVSLLYYQRYIAEKKIKLINESERLLELLIKTAEGAYTYDQAGLSTVFKAKAKKDEIKNMRLMQESDIIESNVGINTLMGRDINKPFKVDTLIVLGEPAIADTFQFLNRPDIASMESQIQSMELKKKLMASASKPDFGLRLTHMQMLDMPAVWSVMGMVSIPIVPWSSGMYKSEVSSMSYDIEAMKLEKRSMVAMVSRMSAEKLQMFKNEKKQLDNFDKVIIPAFEKSFETSLAGYKQNTADYFILLDAWEMLLMKKLERADKELKVLSLYADYQYISGLGK